MPYDHQKYQKEYREKNKENMKKLNKEYYNKNKKKLLDFRKTEEGRKLGRIANWKTYGVIFCDYDLLYDIYINTTHCDVCKIKFSEDKKRSKTTRCLDHDHTITDCENVRAIVCHSCNVKIG